jgi:glutathione S-transferase
MLKLYGVARSRASRNIWALDELGLAHEFVPVIQAYRLADPEAPDAPFNTASPEFRALAPAGLVPVLDDGGFVLTESLAINLYLAKQAGGPLAPTDDREAAAMVASALFAISAVEASALASMYVHAQGRAETEAGRAELDACAEKLARPLATLESQIAAEGHPVGGRFTIADINLAEILRYAQAHPPLLAPCPALRAWLAECQARPAFGRMMARREAEPL